MPDAPQTETPGPRRRYDASGRRAAAQERRLRVLDEAARLFAADGWTSTTIARIAEAAGVSAELVTSSFGTKGALLLSAVRHVGYGGHQDLRVAIAELGLHDEPDREKRVEALIGLVSTIMPHMAPLVPVMHRAADQDLRAREAWLAARGRHGVNSGVIADLVAGGTARPGASDEVYTALLSENYLAFTQDRGWSHEQYVAWLRRTLIAAVEPV